MPATLSYPGVYIEEISSGVRTITGVATSITAFVGRALRGPTNQAITINSYADFERTFGGLWLESALPFAVRDFFLNGGAQAIIVRCYGPDGVVASNATMAVNGLILEAASPGSWGNQLRVRIDHDTRPLPGGLPDPDLFNLSVKDVGTGRVEIFRNIAVVPGHARRVDTVLESDSVLLRAITVPAARPNPPSAAILPGENPDPFSDAFPARYTVVTLPADGGSDGVALTEADISDASLEAPKQGLYALLDADLFNLLCIPPHKLSSAINPLASDLEATLIDTAAAFCAAHRAFLIIDPPYGSTLADLATASPTFQEGLTTTNHAALYFPNLLRPNPLHDNQLEEFAPCGAVAGIMARTDSDRGVWKAPAGLDARLVGVPALSVPLTDAETGQLNPLGVNCLRAMPAVGRVVWGARTLEGNDRLGSEWKYIPVRRTALFIEESLFRGTQWVVFEPNDEPLWAQIRLNLGAFMNSLFRQGAFQGKTPREAYLVKCDRETTTQDDINRGVVNILVGFAPLKPAEFVIIKIQQLAGQIET